MVNRSKRINLNVILIEEIKEKDKDSNMFNIPMVESDIGTNRKTNVSFIEDSARFNRANDKSGNGKLKKSKETQSGHLLISEDTWRTDNAQTFRKDEIEAVDLN